MSFKSSEESRENEEDPPKGKFKTINCRKSKIPVAQRFQIKKVVHSPTYIVSGDAVENQQKEDPVFHVKNSSDQLCVQHQDIDQKRNDTCQEDEEKVSSANDINKTEKSTFDLDENVEEDSVSFEPDPKSLASILNGNGVSQSTPSSQRMSLYDSVNMYKLQRKVMHEVASRESLITPSSSYVTPKSNRFSLRAETELKDMNFQSKKNIMPFNTTSKLQGPQRIKMSQPLRRLSEEFEAAASSKDKEKILNTKVSENNSGPCRVEVVEKFETDSEVLTRILNGQERDFSPPPKQRMSLYDSLNMYKLQRKDMHEKQVANTDSLITSSPCVTPKFNRLSMKADTQLKCTNVQSGNNRVRFNTTSKLQGLQKAKMSHRRKLSEEFEATVSSKDKDRTLSTNENSALNQDKHVTDDFVSFEQDPKSLASILNGHGISRSDPTDQRMSLYDSVNKYKLQRKAMHERQVANRESFITSGSSFVTPKFKRFSMKAETELKHINIQSGKNLMPFNTTSKLQGPQRIKMSQPLRRLSEEFEAAAGSKDKDRILNTKENNSGPCRVEVTEKFETDPEVVKHILNGQACDFSHIPNHRISLYDSVNQYKQQRRALQERRVNQESLSSPGVDFVTPKKPQHLTSALSSCMKRTACTPLSEKKNIRWADREMS